VNAYCAHLVDSAVQQGIAAARGERVGIVLTVE